MIKSVFIIDLHHCRTDKDSGANLLLYICETAVQAKTRREREGGQVQAQPVSLPSPPRDGQAVPGRAALGCCGAGVSFVGRAAPGAAVIRRQLFLRWAPYALSPLVSPK